MSIEKSHNFKRINQNLTTSGVVSAELLESLSTEGYEVVINLLPINHKQAVVNEREIVESQNIIYMNVPIDFNSPGIGDYEKFSKIFGEIENKKVHIHCAANFRVSAFYGAYAVSQDEWSVAEAWSFIRTIWNPDEYPVWHKLLNELGL